MSDDFSDDLETPTEADLDSCYGSKYLGAADLGDKKIRTRIGKVRKETMPQQDGKPQRTRFVLYFKSIDKPLVLNATNKNMLVDKLGKVPANWINAEVGLFTVPTTYKGQPTKGLRLHVFGPAKTAPVKPAKSAKPMSLEEAMSLEETLDDPVPEFGQPAQ
jgi:hypothetical protein